MEPDLVEWGGLKVAGYALPNADARAHLIMYCWVALAPRLHAIPGQVDPSTLYGLWVHRGDGPPAYLVGVQVSGEGALPEGTTLVDVPAGRYAMLQHRGSIGSIGDTYTALDGWFDRAGVPHALSPVAEVYDTTQEIGDRYRLPVYMRVGDS